MGGETAQLSTVNLGTAERRVEREHALDALASKFGLPDRSALIQKIADGDLIIETPDPEQAYFDTPEWQAAEAEASADIATGRVKRFQTMEDLLGDLHSDDDE